MQEADHLWLAILDRGGLATDTEQLDVCARRASRQHPNDGGAGGLCATAATACPSRERWCVSKAIAASTGPLPQPPANQEHRARMGRNGSQRILRPIVTLMAPSKVMMPRAVPSSSRGGSRCMSRMLVGW